MTALALDNETKSNRMQRVIGVIFHPYRTFQIICSYDRAIWLTPMVILSIAVLLNVIVVGKLKYQSSMMGEINYPPDFQYYTPEQQAQYMQTIQSTQGPVFTYVLPGIGVLLSTWFGWLILGGIIHLVATLLGGRGNTVSSMNIVAWASIPFVIRNIVQIVYMLITKKMITATGLSGFITASDSSFSLFISLLLGLFDIYLVWQILLVMLGVRISTKITPPKVIFGVIGTFLIIMLLQTGLLYLVNSLGKLTITRPFFF